MTSTKGCTSPKITVNPGKSKLGNPLISEGLINSINKENMMYKNVINSNNQKIVRNLNNTEIC